MFNFAPQNYFVRPDERYNLGAFAHYEIAPWAEAYMDTMFMDDLSTAQIAAGGIFAGTFSVNCANPLMTAQEKALLVPNGDRTPRIRRRSRNQMRIRIAAPGLRICQSNVDKVLGRE